MKACIYLDCDKEVCFKGFNVGIVTTERGLGLTEGTKEVMSLIENMLGCMYDGIKIHMEDNEIIIVPEGQHIYIEKKCPPLHIY